MSNFLDKRENASASVFSGVWVENESDTDMDGDGIENEDDTDMDGDGVGDNSDTDNVCYTVLNLNNTHKV